MGDGDEEDHLGLDDASGMRRRIEGSLSARLLWSGDDDEDVRKWNLMRELPPYARDRLEFLKEFKSKLHNLEEAAQNVVLEKFSPNIRKRVESLKEIQSQHDQLETKFFEERDALVAKYQKLYEPLYMKRFEVVNGVVEVEGFCDEVTGKTTKDKGKGVPEFWLTAMRTNEVLAEEITERDEGALKYLTDIKWCRICDPKGFKLEFLFDSNPYFKNSVLTKTYHVVDKYDPILEKAIGMEIEWFPWKNLTQKLLVKKSKKGSKNRKPITRAEDCRSFFNFFNPPRIPGYDEYLSNAAAEQLRKQLEQDYEIGSTIRDEIIPHAVLWFTGEAVLDEEEDENEDVGAKEGEEDADDEHEE